MTNHKLHSKREVAAGEAMQRAKQETIWATKALGRQVGVASAEPNYWRQPLAVPDDPLYAEQWHYPQIQLSQAWNVTTGSSDVTVAVIDTGILSNHPDFAGQLVSGADLISDREKMLAMAMERTPIRRMRVINSWAMAAVRFMVLMLLAPWRRLPTTVSAWPALLGAVVSCLFGC